MKSFVSTLFRVMCFHNNGHIVTIDHISFIVPHMMVNHKSSVNGHYMSASSALPQVNYVATCPMHETPNEQEYLPSSDLDLVVDMALSSIGIS
jgi:hypothetical protein